MSPIELLARKIRTSRRPLPSHIRSPSSRPGESVNDGAAKRAAEPPPLYAPPDVGEKHRSGVDAYAV